MAPKALILLPLLAPFTVAWGSSHDLYIRDAIPEPNPYAYEEALAARAIAARKVYAAKARRAANGRVVLSRQINARTPKAKPNPEAHAFQQYDAGLFRRDGSVIPRDPYPYAGASAVAQPDPELWFQGGELYARSHSDDDDDWEDADEEKPKKKSAKKTKAGKKSGKKSGRKSEKKAEKESDAKEDEEDQGDEKTETGDKGEKESKGLKSWFSSLFKW